MSAEIYEYKRVLAGHSHEPGDDNQSPEETLGRYGPQGWRLAAAFRVPGGEILYLERRLPALPDPAQVARSEAAERLLSLATEASIRSVSHGPRDNQVHEICLGWRTSGARQMAADTIIRAALAETGAASQGD